MESLDFCAMETSVSEQSLSDKSMTSSTSTTCEQSVWEEENRPEIASSYAGNAGFAFNLDNDGEGGKGENIKGVGNMIVEHNGSDSSLDGHVNNAILDKNCNLQARNEGSFSQGNIQTEKIGFNNKLCIEEIPGSGVSAKNTDKKTTFSEQLYDKKTFSKEKIDNKIFSTEQLYDKKTSSTKKMCNKITFSKEQHHNEETLASAQNHNKETFSAEELCDKITSSTKQLNNNKIFCTQQPYDKIISKTEQRRCSQNSVSTSEDSRTLVIEQVEKELGNDSLDEISSGEMVDFSEGRESHLSVAMSDCWDEEEYLSEHNYNESLDEDRARKLLNFGDDYRNFIGSMSDGQSSINTNDVLGQPSKNIRRRNRKKMISGKNLLDSQSEAEIENVCNIIEASQKGIISANNVSKQVFTGGFLKKEQSQEYNELMETCSENLKLLIHLLQSIDFDNSFVSKKKSREIRSLLCQWERLLGKIKDNCQKAGIYDSLKDDICTLRKDILTLIEDTDNIDAQDSDANLETKLHMFKDAMMELTSFKSRLFQLNLSVHNFLAVLSNSKSMDQMQMDQALGLKRNVVELYALWDQSHHRTLGCISQTEISLRKLDEFQKELLDLTNQLRQDSQNLSQQKRPRAERKNNSSSDSGISDGSGSFSDSDISLREQQLTKLRMMASNLQINLSPNSSALALISQTIETTSSQMKELHKSFLKYKKGKKKLKRGHLTNKARNEKLAHKQTLAGSSVRGRLVRMAMAIQLVLMLVVFLSWLCQPICCDNYNSMSFTPQLRYIDGPPPI